MTLDYHCLSKYLADRKYLVNVCGSISTAVMVQLLIFIHPLSSKFQLRYGQGVLFFSLAFFLLLINKSTKI